MLRVSLLILRQDREVLAARVRVQVSLVSREPEVGKDDFGLPNWRKSSACDDTNCVEVAMTSIEVFVRDSADVSHKVLTVSLPVWETFVSGLRNGDTSSRHTRLH